MLEPTCVEMPLLGILWTTFVIRHTDEVSPATEKCLRDKAVRHWSSRTIHQGSPGKGLRDCWHLRRIDPLNLIQFTLA